MLGVRSYPPRYERCQHSHPVQEQLSRHLSSERCWQSLRSGHLDSTAEPRFASLPRVTVWLQIRDSTVDMILSLRQLQEICREQQQSLFLAFVDLTKAFDLVSRSGLFKILQKIGCPSKLLAIIISFHQDMQSGLLRWGHFQCLPSQQWSKAGLCPCSSPVWDFLLDAAPVCLCRVYTKCLRTDKVRQQTLQHRQTLRPKPTWCSYGSCCLQTTLF